MFTWGTTVKKFLKIGNSKYEDCQQKFSVFLMTAQLSGLITYSQIYHKHTKVADTKGKIKVQEIALCEWFISRKR